MAMTVTAPLAPCLYTEARLNIEPTYANSTLHIPTEGPSSFFSRKRSRADDTLADADEDAYAKRHLATESSIFFRRQNRNPRCFLWRVLEERKLLHIQSVDLIQARRNTQESVITFALSFSSPIRHNGVAFADAVERDALEVFVLTTSGELFTFTLRKDLLLRGSLPSPAEFDPTSCFKVHQSPSFSFRVPYKLVALSSMDLLVSLGDGGLLRLSRNVGQGQGTWHETSFSEPGWGSSFKTLFSMRSNRTVKIDGLDLEPSTAVAIALSPDTTHVFTVCLDHTLKAWNTQTGKLGVQTDLLGDNHREIQSASSQFVMSTATGTLLKLLQVDGSPDGDMYYAVTNSPKDHQFKFWAVMDPDDIDLGIRDVQPDTKLIPPLDELMNTNAWQLVEYHVRPSKGWRNTQLWIRVRSGAICKIFTLTFDLLSVPEDLEDAWRNNWALVDDGSLTIEALMNDPSYPGDADIQLRVEDYSSLSDRWLDFFFYPGRFSVPMLESALHIYKRGLKLSIDSSRSIKESPLKGRICDAIAAKISVDQDSEGQLDFDKYQSEIAAQWHVFFGLVRHLHTRRGNPLSLAFDMETDLAWSIRADQVGPVRQCSEVEIMNFNKDVFLTQEDSFIVNSMPLADHLTDETSVHIGRLLAGARTFRRGLSSEFQTVFEAASAADALKIGGNDTTPNGIQEKHLEDVRQLYEICALHSEVTDEDFNQLTDSMQELGGLGDLDNELFYAAIERLAEPEQGADGDQALTRYGDKATIRGAQDTLTLTRDILLDLLALVVFMAGDLEEEELSPSFRPSELYEQLVMKLKEHNVLLWLASNVREEPKKKAKDAVDSPVSKSNKSQYHPTLTVLESIFIGDWHSLRFPASETLPFLITYWCRAWTYGANISNAYNGVVWHILGNLLKHQDYDLATDFLKFVPEGSWASYLRGRLNLAVGEYALAAEYFKQAAEKLASSEKNHKIDELDTSGLIDSQARNFFNDGPPRYYLHISYLFERSRLYAYTADFASLAAQEFAVNFENFDDNSLIDLDTRKQGMHGSPAATRVNLAMEEIKLLRVRELKEDILMHVFSASLQICRYKPAFEALLVFGNPVLRKTSLQALLQSLIATNRMSTLLSLPFPDYLLPEVDDILLSLARKHLSFSPTPTPGQPQYHQVMYTWRIHNNDFRGAAEILFERLQRLRHSTAKVFEPDDETLVEAYLVLINTLACCGKDEGWILAERVEEEYQRGKSVSANHSKKRRIVTLEDVRKEYQAELDRRSEMQQGRFALTAGDEMDMF
jgi:WD40 repeat protein/tetratricopeptide (TPR) repeat protein